MTEAYFYIQQGLQECRGFGDTEKLRESKSKQSYFIKVQSNPHIACISCFSQPLQQSRNNNPLRSYQVMRI